MKCKLTLAIAIIAATLSTSALAADYAVLGNVGVGNHRVDSVVGITAQANNVIDGFGVYATVNKAFMPQERTHAINAIHKDRLTATYHGYSWATGTTYTYQNLTGFVGFTRANTTINIDQGKNRIVHDKRLANGVDVGVQYNFQPVIVGMGYNSATKTSQMSLGYSF